MILIISYEHDHSTNNVIKYLHKNNRNYIRLGVKQFINSLTIKFEKEIEILVRIFEKEINFKDITSFWYRKHFLEILPQLDFHLIKSEKHFNNSFSKKFFTKDDIQSIRNFLIHELEKKSYLGNMKEKDGNKLISFSIAMECALNTPYTYLSSSTDLLKSIHLKNKNTIVKPVEDAFFLRLNKTLISSKYEMTSEALFENKEQEILPSCIQGYLDKKIELRIFYLKGKFWSMAIFSQFDTKTRIDFRNYNDEKPNRMVPYNLPTKIISKLHKFMKKMKLDTGSIDMILTNENKYIFLEVNPVGQYGMVGMSCNYSLDNEIAKILMK